MRGIAETEPLGDVVDRLRIVWIGEHEARSLEAAPAYIGADAALFLEQPVQRGAGDLQPPAKIFAR